MTESKPEHATAWPACRRTGRWTDRIGTGTRTRDCLTCLWQNWQVNWWTDRIGTRTCDCLTCLSQNWQVNFCRKWTQRTCVRQLDFFFVAYGQKSHLYLTVRQISQSCYVILYTIFISRTHVFRILRILNIAWIDLLSIFLTGPLHWYGTGYIISWQILILDL